LRRDLWWKIALVVAVVVIFTAAIIPTKNNPERIPLGLDLKGGTHLVMQVNTGDALAAEVDQGMETVKSQAQKASLPTPMVRRATLPNGQPDPSAFVLTSDGAVNMAQYERIVREWLPAFESTPSAQGLRVQLNAQQAAQIEDQTVLQAIETIRNRVDAFGVTEPIIARAGVAGKRIVIQLPGVDDPVRVKEIIRTTAQLQFRIVEGGTAPNPQSIQLPAGVSREDVDILAVSRTDEFGRRTGTEYQAVRKAVPVTGRDLKTARVQKGELGTPNIGFSLTPDGAKKFGALTGANVGRQLAIVLDDRIQSAPVIRSQIIDQGVIEGSFSPQEAADLALILRSGSLPASLTTMEERTVGPSLGLDSIRKGVTASIIGFVLMVIGVVLYYKGAGINAVVALLLNLIILLGMMAYFDATLTLPGIAGIILTLGMAIDSNVLVFERIREERRAGKSVRGAIDSGFSLAFGTVIDTHLTTMIAALFLFQFGTGPVKGFAVTLLIGLAASVFTAFFVSRIIFELVYNRTNRPVASISI
jgi:preprotein translocase subunit SecD